MIRIVPAAERHFSHYGWLKTYWLFSFSDYHDPANIRFGSLRVFNDDIIAPGGGFPTHPHREMEIVTVVLDGELTHEDSMGNRGVIKAGEVQRMSAGTGVTHSEFNLGEKPLHLYQIWIIPGKDGRPPSYDQKGFDRSSWENRLFPVASGRSIPGAVTFHSDATIYRAALDAGREITIEETAGRKIFIYLTGGEISVNDHTMKENDQARIDVETPVTIRAGERSELVVIES